MTTPNIRIEWGIPTVKWTPDGYELSLTIVGTLSVRQQVAIHEHLDAALSPWTTVETLRVDGGRIAMTLPDLLDVDGASLREILQKAVTNALTETATATAFDVERTAGWVAAFRTNPDS